MDLTIDIREGTHKKKVILNFLIGSCKSTFRGILGRSFMERLVVVASPSHLKVIYHEDKRRLAIASIDVDEGKRIK